MENQSEQDLETIKKAKQIFRKYKEAHSDHNPNPTESKNKRSPEKWKPPLEGRYKINTDAAFDSTKSSYYFGAVIRDNEGQVLAATSIPSLRSITVEDAEALAMHAGVRFALELGFFDLILESDSRSVVNMVNGTDSSVKFVGMVVDDIIELILNCRSVSITHVRRVETNQLIYLPKMG